MRNGRRHSAIHNPQSAIEAACPGVEPDPRPSQSRVQSATLTGCKYRVRESNPVPQFRRLRCYPAHPHGMFSISTWSRTRTRAPTGMDAGWSFRRVLCGPLHHRDMGPTTRFAPASPGLQNRRLAIRPRRHLAGVQGIRAPMRSIGRCWAVLEAACFPEAHSCRPAERCVLPAYRI